MKLRVRQLDRPSKSQTQNELVLLKEALPMAFSELLLKHVSVLANHRGKRGSLDVRMQFHQLGRCLGSQLIDLLSYCLNIGSTLRALATGGLRGAFASYPHQRWSNPLDPLEFLGIDSREHVVINEAMLDPLDQASPTGLGPVEGAAQTVQFTLVDKTPCAHPGAFLFSFQWQECLPAVPATGPAKPCRDL